MFVISCHTHTRVTFTYTFTFTGSQKRINENKSSKAGHTGSTGVWHFCGTGALILARDLGAWLIRRFTEAMQYLTPSVTTTAIRLGHK